MCFTVNIAFINYLDKLSNSLNVPILFNQTTHEQILPNSLQSFDFNPDLLKSPKMLKDFVYPFQHKKETFDLQNRHNNDFDLAMRNSFFSNCTIDIFMFVTAII